VHLPGSALIFLAGRRQSFIHFLISVFYIGARNGVVDSFKPFHQGAETGMRFELPKECQGGGGAP